MMRTVFCFVFLTAGSLAENACSRACAAWRSATALYAAGLGGPPKADVSDQGLLDAIAVAT